MSFELRPGPPNGMEVFGSGGGVPAGGRAYWQIDAPSGMAIVGVHTEGSGMISYGVNANMGGAAASTGRAAARRHTERDRVQLPGAVL